MYCKNCGAKMPKDRDYCIRCGGKNQSVPSKSIVETNPIDFQPALPMNFHYFYLVLMFLGIILSLYEMVVSKFTIYGICSLLFSLVTFVTLGKQQKVGYILFLVTNTISIVLVSIFYGMFLLALFGISILEGLNPFHFIATMHTTTDYLAIAEFTGIIVVIILILLAIRKYYTKRKGMFS